MACWLKINFHLLVNRKITLPIDRKNLQLTDNQRDYWPKVPNFYVPIYPYKTYIFYCYENFLPGTCCKNFLIMYKVLRFHGFPVTVMWSWGVFSIGQCNVCSSDSLNFCTYLSIQNVNANYNILGNLKNLVLNIWSMQHLQFGFFKFSYILILTKCLCKLQHT